MTSYSLSLPQANFKLALWQAQADSMSDSDLYVWISDSGFVDDVAIRLHQLVTTTKTIQGKVISIGKIILIKIVEFIKQHPYLSAGVALGIIIGLLVNSIPFIGQILTPLATVLGITIGAIAGHRRDKRMQGKDIANDTFFGVAEEVVEIVHDFFKLMIEVFGLILQEFQQS